MEEKLEVLSCEEFQKWHENLKDDRAVFKIQCRIDLMAQGSFGNSKSVGKGVTESIIDYGPGYRIYFGRKGKKLVVLLAGSQKKDQQKTIEEAQRIWAGIKGNL
ncbi:MAG: addiction module antitoxin RelB [Nitrospinae bacterium CG11_big_fil_rev_8_21_14_0_20_56_8]|nr:MAG: addiction module antitoxin RelB [Nitrospinae bacterium CG11_big_fil_rev_8_21_14_0_20_56_8]